MMRLFQLTFNLDDGYIEAVVRGLRSDILTETEYSHLTECDTLEGITSQHDHQCIYHKAKTTEEPQLSETQQSAAQSNPSPHALLHLSHNVMQTSSRS